MEKILQCPFPDDARPVLRLQNGGHSLHNFDCFYANGNSPLCKENRSTVGRIPR